MGAQSYLIESSKPRSPESAPCFSARNNTTEMMTNTFRQSSTTLKVRKRRSAHKHHS